MLSLDAVGWSLVLSHLDTLGFVDSQWEDLPFLRSDWGERGEEEWEEGKDGELWLLCKMSKKHFLKT